MKGVAGIRTRDSEPLLLVGHGRGARERRRRRRGLGQLPCLAEKGGGRPRKRRKDFSFYFSTKQPQKFIFEQKNSFLGHDPKTKVVQNFILYNITLGYILKFQLDFEIGI
jgi:hypothetical protein